MGASLRQAWEDWRSFGAPPPICLISSEQTLVSGHGISTLVRLPVDELVRLTCAVLNHSIRESAGLFMFTGRTGHVVSGISADQDGDGITFVDPWPGSLLSKTHNTLDVDARQTDDGWHLTSAELTRTLIAVFVNPATWAVINGQTGRPAMAEVRRSDFWRRSVDILECDDADPTRVVVTARPHDLGENGKLQVTYNEKGEVNFAELQVRQSFTGVPPYSFNASSAIALHHFLANFVPPADRAAMQPLTDELRILHRMEFLTKANRFDYRDSEVGRFAFAFLGMTGEEFGAFGTQSFLRVRTNLHPGQDAWTEVSLDM